MNTHADAEAFVRAWQASRSIAEVAEKLGLDAGDYNQRRTLSNKAQRFRDRGVPLRYFEPARIREETICWLELAQLARELEKQK